MGAAEAPERAEPVGVMAEATGMAGAVATAAARVTEVEWATAPVWDTPIPPQP